MNDAQPSPSVKSNNPWQSVMQTPPPGYKKTEVGIIPEDWEAVPIGRLLTFKNGLNKAKQYFGSGTPIVNYMDVYQNPGLLAEKLSGKVNVTLSEQRNYSAQLGDVFFTRTSETVEEIGMSAVLLDDVDDAVFSGFLLRGRPISDALQLDYRKYCFRHEPVRQQIISTSSYTTRALTNGRLLSRVFIFLPPTLAEQLAIAEALSDVDALISALDRLIAKKRAIKQGAMQELLTGSTRLPGFSGEWEVKTLGASCEVITKGTTPTSIGRDFTLSGINFLKAESIGENGQPIPSKTAFIDEFTHKLLKRSQLNEGDILISIAGVLGRVGIVEGNALPANTNQALAVIRLGKESEFERSYLFYYLRSPMIQKQISDISVQAAQANISLQNVREFQINVPRSREEQTAIATVLSDMDAEIASLEQRRDKTRLLKQGMMQELLTGKTRLL